MNDDDINRVELRGRLTQDPQMRYTAGGTAVAHAGMATNRRATVANGESKELTEFHNLVAWQDRAKELGQMGKGERIHVRGRLTTNAWEGRDGQKRRTTEIVIEQFVATEARATAALDEDIPDFQ